MCKSLTKIRYENCYKSITFSPLGPLFTSHSFHSKTTMALPHFVSRIFKHDGPLFVTHTPYLLTRIPSCTSVHIQKMAALYERILRNCRTT